MRDTNKLKFVLYARKSTEDEGKQVQSIDDQLNIMTKIAREQGLNIVAKFHEARSAGKTGQRPEFQRMLDMLNSGKANAVLCWHANRLARNHIDGAYICQMLQDGVIQKLKTSEREYLPTDNMIMLAIEFGMANEALREIMKNVRRGMYSKADRGVMPNRAPIGYLNDRDNKTIIPDPDRFESVRKLWDLMLTGTYSVRDITSMAQFQLGIISKKRKKSGGKPISYGGMHNIFNNPFYKGSFRFSGVRDNGKHVAMVTPEEWDKVQEIIHRKDTTRPKDITYDFMFRGLLKCGDCGFSIVSQRKVKRQDNGNVHEYTYCSCSGRRKNYACSQKSQYIREEVLDKQIKNYLITHTIDPEFYALAIEALAEMNDGEVAKQSAISHQQDLAISRKETEIRELMRQRYKGFISDDDFYKSEMVTLEAELGGLRKDRAKAESNAVNWRKLANETFTFARYAKEDYDKGDLEAKRAVIVKFGQNLTVLNGEV